MKKRLLITSIVMMLVVAVALSTATYAWFTSNDQVTANTVSLTAATSTQSAIGIAWKAPAGSVETNTPAWNANYSTYIAPYSMVADIQPAAPAYLNDLSKTALPTFNTAFITSQGTFKGDGTPTSVYRMSNYANAEAATADNGADFYDTIHIANLAQTGGASKPIYMTATITGQLVATTSEETADTATYNYYNADKEAITPTNGEALGAAGYKEKKDDGIALIRIAVYIVDRSGASPVYTCKGCLSKNGNGSTNDTAVGAIGGGNSAAALVSTTGFASTQELKLGTIAPQTEKEYVVFIWMDGQALDESQSGKKAEITLNFTTSGTATELNP